MWVVEKIRNKNTEQVSFERKMAVERERVNHTYPHLHCGCRQSTYGPAGRGLQIQVIVVSGAKQNRSISS